MIEVHEIGVLYQRPAAAAPRSPPEAPIALVGWHVNTTAPVAAWQAFSVIPQQPRVVFAGAPTFHYTFPDRAEYLKALKDADLNPKPPARVPSEVTMRQARLALLMAGKLNAVNSALAALPEPQKSAAQIEWEYSGTVERKRGLVLSLAPMLGLTDAQTDALFIQAGRL